jgi:uncharacterized heparinase superfamily protein
MSTGKAAQFGRLWRTVRWLKPVQVLGRLRFRLQRPRPDTRPAPPRRTVSGAWVVPAARAPSLIPPTRLRFLGEEHDLDRVGWDDPSLALLWRYNQHYFDDLVAVGAASRRDHQRALLARWRAENPPGLGTAYAPYPVSLRIVNWVKCFLGGVEPEPAWLDSLALQARWLARRLEWHLLGNHLFVNAKALLFAGLYFDGAEADDWAATGLRILRAELDEQILPDGGQFERSPMYHALALEDVLDLLNLVRALAPPGASARTLEPVLRAHSGRMLHWLRCMTLPDGSLPRFNDSAAGIAPDNAELERYAAELDIDAARPPAQDGITLLQPSGYLRVQRGPATALLDAAPIGPDYLPGHAHADTLSFELALQGRTLVVNRGTSVYGDGPRRQRERGTAAHSTVQVGDQDSSEVWAGFRVGRRARPGPVAVNGFEVDASHDGYSHLQPATRHHRRWRFDVDGLEIDDRLDAVPASPACARLHLAPGLGLVPPAGPSQPWRVCEGARPLALVDAGSEAHSESWDHALGFGKRVPATTLCVPLVGGRARVRLRWCG